MPSIIQLPFKKMGIYKVAKQYAVRILTELLVLVSFYKN